MKKSVFTNRIFYILLIGFIIILLAYNCVISIKASNFYGLITIFIEIILLALILKKNRYAKLAIIMWAILFSLVGCGSGLIANLMDDFNNDFSAFNIYLFIYNIIGLAIGILIIDYTRRTVILVSSDADLDQKAKGDKAHSRA